MSLSPHRWGFGWWDWSPQGFGAMSCCLSQIPSNEKLLPILGGGSLEAFVIFLPWCSCRLKQTALKCPRQAAAASQGTGSQELRMINQTAGPGPPWPQSCPAAPQSKANPGMTLSFSQKSRSSGRFMLVSQVQG